MLNTNNLITFVCCIEYGALENQTLLMLKTFRENAGNLRNSRILAVQPRFGATLNVNTIKTLEELSVELIIDYKNNPYKWFNYANKIAAVTIAQSIAKTDLITWLDSDILIANEPTELILENEVDFAARCEFLPPAVHSNETEHIPYWNSLCKLLGTEYDKLPELECDHRQIQLKMYFNSGVFVWRRASNFSKSYHNAFVKLINSKIAQYDGNFFTADQVILGPVIIGTGLRWKHLRYTTHHMTFQSQIDGPIASPHMGNSAIIHYSKSLMVPYRQKMLARIKEELPKVYVSFKNDFDCIYTVPFQSKTILAKFLRSYRGLRWMIFSLSIKKVKKG